MTRHLVILGTLGCLAAGPAAAAQESWLFRQGPYSHDPAGRRVAQYAAKAPSLAPVDPTYVQSGYRHRQTRLRGPGGSADRLHVVETWGAGEAIRPYGEWLFPYRAGATPFGPWGNPQGPWTMPFDSWVNPYGQWNRYPLYSPYPVPYGTSPGPYRGGPGYGHGYPPSYPTPPGGPHAGPPYAHTPHGSPTGPPGAYGPPHGLHTGP
jgi:hypothetical protein